MSTEQAFRPVRGVIDPDDGSLAVDPDGRIVRLPAPDPDTVAAPPASRFASLDERTRRP